MASKYLTVQAVAREALLVLYNYLTIGRVIYKDMQQEFTGTEQRGDTVNIRRPANFKVRRHGVDPYHVQDVNEGKIPLKLEEHFSIEVGVTMRDLTLSLNSFSEQIIAPVVRPMAEEMDSYFLSKFNRIGTHVGTAGTPPSSLGDVTNVDLRLNEQRVPRMRRVQICNPLANARMLAVDSFVEADKRGDGGSALETAETGRILGITNYMGHGVPNHVAGTATGAALLVNGNFSAGATSINLDGGAATETLLVGDPIMIGDRYGYVVTQDATAAAGAFTGVQIFPPLHEDVADNTAIVPVPANHVVNAAFDPDAFGFAAVPLAQPMSNVRSEVVNFEGISMRVTYDWSSEQKKDVISFDTLVGAECIQPALATRVLG